jgi:hypothetical protein
MNTRPAKLALTALAAVGFTVSAWAQQPPVQLPGVPPQAQAAKKSPFLVDVKLGNSAYVPMGSSRPATPPYSREGFDPLILSVAVRNMTATELKNVKIEAVLYKFNIQGKIVEAAKIRDTLDFSRGELKVVYATGELHRPYDRTVDIVRYGHRSTQPERPREESYGWYVRIFLDSEKVFEKADPSSLASSEEVKKSLTGPAPRR